VNLEKIETLFSDQPDLSSGQNKLTELNFAKRLKIRHLFWLLSFAFKKIYRVMPKILKDVFFFLSIIHKSPSSKFFANTRYDEIRTLIDIWISSLTLKFAPISILNDLKNTFSSGFYCTRVSGISQLDKLIENVIDYANPSHAGARPFFKDGKNIELDNSFSIYFTFSKEDNHKINNFLIENLDQNINYHLSVLAGYKCKLSDMSHSLGIVFGENSNSEMHQDTYASVAKGFIYLQEVKEGNSPFEYLQGSYQDASFRSKKTNEAVINDDTFSSGSTRLRGENLKTAIKTYGLKSFIGDEGMFILANTAGYHRKGAHNSSKPRIILACGVKRKGLIRKLLINFIAILKSKFNLNLKS
tara:strand:- start:1650 stop:2720 length:1071 start_codon:yes stop_codon:yes gene_type:complete